MAKTTKYTKRLNLACSQEHVQIMAQKGIKPEHIRAFIEKFDSSEVKAKKIRSDDWRRLKDIITKVPSLQLIGHVNAGKSYLARELVKNDKDHVYIVLDSHGGYDFLPKIHQITPNVKESCLLELPKNDEAAGLNFKLYKTLIQHDVYPKHFILLIDESLRYKNYGLKLMLAESRKFLKMLVVTQERIVEFVPELHVENYNKINI